MMKAPQIMLRGRVMSSRAKMVRTSVILPEDVHTQVIDLAARNDVSAAWVMRHALVQFLKEHSGRKGLPLQMQKEEKGARKTHA
jgi:predicted transcriptional regulator